MSPQAPVSHTSSRRNALLAICASPPTTSGLRTRNRLALARDLLAFEKVQIVNIFNAPTQSTRDLTIAGVDPLPWAIARHEIESQLDMADGVLLCYGVSTPSGPARLQWQTQTTWLSSKLAPLSIPTWTVGGLPRHPSRWQRYTYKELPDMDFRLALQTSLRLTNPS